MPSTAPLRAPVLRTARLVLEPFADTPAHSAGMFALWSQAAVCRHAGPAFDAEGRPIPLPARTAADSDRILAFFIRRAAQGLGLRWAMRETGAQAAFLGAVGFNHLSPRAELAYHLHPQHWGRGLMTEAAQAALAWRQADYGPAEVEAFIAPDNAPSIRLAQRLGFRATGEVKDGAGRYLREA